MRLAVPDLVSTSYFPALAAVGLDIFSAEGVDVEVESIFPITKAVETLRDGDVDFVVGPAHALLSAFPRWDGAKLIAAVVRGTYWVLVLRSDLELPPEGIGGLTDAKIGAAKGPSRALHQLLAEAGLDLARNRVEVCPVPGASEPGRSFGMTAADALRNGLIDGFWANRLGAETAVKEEVGHVVLDPRLGQGPPRCGSYTFAAVMATDATIAARPEKCADVVRAIGKAQTALRERPEVARDVVQRVIPGADADLITEIVRRESRFYSAEISAHDVEELNAFAIRAGLLDATVPFDGVVAAQFRSAW